MGTVMITGIFHKLSIVDSYMTTTTGTLLSTAGATGVFPVGPTLFKTFPTLDGTAAVKDSDVSLFTGARIETQFVGSFTGDVSVFSPTTYNVIVPGNVSFSLVGTYFAIRTAGTATIGGTNVGRLTSVDYDPGTNTTSFSMTLTGTHTTGTITFSIFKRIGFSMSNRFTLYSVNSSTTTTNAKYMSATVSFFSNNGGAATKSLTLLLPLNTPFKVKLPDSEMAAATYKTAITAISPSFTTLIDGVQTLTL
jgi:hypothetical protein